MFWSRMTLLFIILIDALGISIVYPALSYYFLDPQSQMFPASVSEDKRLFFLGLVFAIYPLFMAVGSLKIGKLSDQWGRKKALIICLIGFILGFIILSIGAILHSLWLIILGRIIAGLTAGCHVIAQASMADISRDSVNKAKNISAVVMANTLGFIIGPALGGLLSSTELVPIFTVYTPFVVVAFLGVIALICLHLFYQETFVAMQIPPEAQLALNDLRLFKNKDLLFLCLVYFLFTFGWNLFFQFVPVYLLEYFNVLSATTGLFMSFVSLIFMISTGMIVQPCLHVFGLHRCLWIGLLLLLVGLWLSLGMVQFHLFWITVIPLCIGGGFVYTVCLSLYSDSASHHHQGHILGVASVVKSLAWALAPIISGIIASISITWPMALAGICFAVALPLALLLRSKVS